MLYIYKIMILLKNSLETSWPVSTKFHVDLTVEKGLLKWSCAIDCHSHIRKKKKINK